VDAARLSKDLDDVVADRQLPLSAPRKRVIVLQLQGT
jgi:hypothetical protein